MGGRDWVAGRFESYRDAYAYVVSFTNENAYELAPARTDVIYGRRLFLFDNDMNGAMSINVRNT
ncbi:hypothetical protein GTE7_gp093 [Gordonia phage GTE7]|uniref:Uncharacterized protein n=1 Tax=Gordonia phage GTE7 TaxID=1100814 RepID=G8FS86_9CAUD|nr:hypothetical protein GTE7_gp093 [Gordonia phage GTE7]AER26636.1 hypothetical protein [Gordonia phage GTE7]